MKGSKKLEKYFDLARELKKWNMKVTVMSILDDMLRTVLKNLKKRRKELVIRRRMKTIMVTLLLRLVRILKRVQCYIVTYVDSHLHICTYICRIIHSDTTIKTHEGKRRNEGRMKASLQLYLLLILLKEFERVVQRLHVRGCWRPNISFICSPLS